MGEHFLTEITIKEFKCFRDFTAKGFKRVNLIGGMNNIGKTALMEACFINVSSESVNTMITAISKTKYARECINFVYKPIEFKELVNSISVYSVDSNINKASFRFIIGDAKIKYSIFINEKESEVTPDWLAFPVKNKERVTVISNFGWVDKELSDAYQAVQKKDKEYELNKLVNEFDNAVVSFKVIGGKIQCKKNTEYQDISEFGDGLRHYISIICALYSSENGYLFIDEIDNGIYYTQLDRLWEIILTISKEVNCQVFATTHSKEMLESFARVAKKLDEEDISYTVLVKNKQQEIKAITRDYEMILDSIEDGREVR